MTTEHVEPLHILPATDDSESVHRAESWVSRRRWS
jgi:hypothetical protein